jgi:predicted PurR-regulated permease PerM
VTQFTTFCDIFDLSFLGGYAKNPSMKMLRQQYPEALVSLAALLAALISILGILALLAAIFRE